MNKFYIPFVGLVLVMLVSCTSARWTVKEKTALDKSDYKILHEQKFLGETGEVSPDNPVLKLNLYSRTTYEYSQRVLMQRNIQKYRLRPGFVALGLSGAAMAFYLANSNAIRGNQSSAKKITLNGLGALLAVSGFLNMKPTGVPRPTGEERFLRSTGTIVDIDTLAAEESNDEYASVKVTLNDRLIFEEDHYFTNGSVEVGLASKLNDLQLKGADPGTLNVEATFKDSSYRYQYPVDHVLKPYAKVSTQLTELRNSPEESLDNVLADLVRGSQLQIQGTENEDWYRVLYGISENYVRKRDVELVWRSADFIPENQVVTVPRVPFGNIDVESNIPILRGPNENALALIITNENYSGNLEQREYAHRDGRLIRAYLKNALGFKVNNIFELADVSDSQIIISKLADIKSEANDTTELFVYISGYGIVERGGSSELNLLGVSNGEASPKIPLNTLFEQIGQIPSSHTLVLSDIDYSAMPNRNLSTTQARGIIEASVVPLINSGRSALLLGTQLQNPSSLFVSQEGEDKKHHVFPYFFAKALQNRKTNISDIYQYLERNVSYTARRLFDRPQDPLLIGNTSLDLVSQ